MNTCCQDRQDYRHTGILRSGPSFGVVSHSPQATALKKRDSEPCVHGLASSTRQMQTIHPELVHNVSSANFSRITQTVLKKQLQHTYIDQVSSW